MMRLFATLFLLLFAAITMSTPTYATPADVSDTYGAEYVYEKATGEVGTLDVDDAEAPATRKVQAALDKAANRINAAVQRRYGELPFTEHALLSDLNAEGAWYELWSTSRAGMDEETARLHKVWLEGRRRRRNGSARPGTSARR